MNWRDYVRSHLPPLHVSAERELEIIEELAVQLESTYERARGVGADHDDAVARAREEVPDWKELAVMLGRVERASMPSSDPGRSGAWSSFAVDGRHALRSVVKWKAAIATITMLGLSIAAPLTVASAVQSWMPAPPFAHAERLTFVWGTNHSVGQARDVVSGPTFIDWQRQASSFEGIAAFAQGSLAVRRDGHAGAIDTMSVTPDFFAVAGVRAHAGRLFEAQDAGLKRIVLSYEFWQSQYAGDPGIIGRTLRDLDLAHEVIGVLPPGFRLLSSPEVVTVLDPRVLEGETRTFYYYWVIGRLRDGTSVAAAQSDLDAVMRRLSSQYPVMKGWTATLESLSGAVSGPIRPSLMVLIAIASLVLLVGTGNTVNLVASRALERRREMAIRTAIGASASRVKRQWAIEGLLVSTAATAMGIVIAVGAIAAVSAIAPSTAAIPGSAATVDLAELQFHPSAGWLAVIIAFILSVVLGATPWQSLSLIDLRSAFATAPVTLTRGRQWLLTGQSAIATLLTCVAGLLLLFVMQLAATSPGFDASRVTAFLVGGLHDLDAPARARYYARLLEVVRSQPGVAAAALNDYVPLTNEDDYEGIEIPGQRRDGEPSPREEWRRVSAGYFETLGIPLVKGRLLAAADDEGAVSVLVISAAMAQKYWPDRDPIGTRVRITNKAFGWSEIVGVVGDVREAGLDRPGKPMMFVPMQRDPRPEMGLFVRASTDADTTVMAIQQAVWSVDATRPILDARAMGAIVRDSYSVPRAVLSVAAGLALLALALIAGGTYAIVSLVTLGRRHEMGIRISLGARPADVAAAVLGAPCTAAAVGIAIGLVFAWPAAALVRSQMTGVSGIDWPTAAFAAGAVATVVVLACARPALRAMRTDPVITLRGE